MTRLDDFHLLHHIRSLVDLAKDDVLVVEKGRGHGGDEELRAVGVGTGVLEHVNQDIIDFPREHTAMDSKKGLSCLRVKFSSSNDLNPQIHVEPVPSALRKSPPWHMKLGICLC